jgi:hypothetical protein
MCGMLGVVTPNVVLLNVAATVNFTIFHGFLQFGFFKQDLTQKRISRDFLKIG